MEETKQQRLLFIDRDGTIVEEPYDEQVDSFEKLKFVKDVIKNLTFIQQHTDFKLVMVSNQDGLGTDAFPESDFYPVHNFIMQTLEGEGIVFSAQHIDRHMVGKDIRLYECKNCVVHAADESKVVVQGLDGYIVVEKHGQLLVCSLKEEQRIKEFGK